MHELQCGGVRTMIVTVVCVSASAWFQLGLTSKSALVTEVVQCFSVFWLHLDKDVFPLNIRGGMLLLSAHRTASIYG